MALSAERIKELEKAESKLLALEAGGVDNWNGYDFAMEDFRKEEKYEELLEEVAGCVVDAISDCIEEPAGRGCGYGIRKQGYINIAEVLKKYSLKEKDSK